MQEPQYYSRLYLVQFIQLSSNSNGTNGQRLYSHHQILLHAREIKSQTVHTSLHDKLHNQMKTEPRFMLV